MQLKSAREWLVKSSLILTGATMAFFLVAPTLGFPLTYEKSVQFLAVITPVFAGYIGTASKFVFSKFTPNEAEMEIERQPLFGLLLRGPLIVYTIGVVGLIVGFGYSNRLSATTGDGMTTEVFGISLSLILAFLAAANGALIAKLFHMEEGRADA